jgi:uncharacterized protein
MEKLASLIIRLRYGVIAFVLITTFIFGYFLKDLTVNPDVLGYLPDDDPAAMLFNKIGEGYGGNEMIIIGVKGKEVFETEMLRLISQITDSVRSVSGIGYVTSLTNVIDIKGTDSGIEIGRLIDEYDLPVEKGELDSLKTYTLSKKMYRRNLVSEDATATLIIAKVSGDANRTGAVEDIRNKLSQIEFEGDIYYGGMPVTLLELSKVIMHDISFIAPLALVLICLVLFLGFRSTRGVLLPVVSVIIAIIWTLGLMSLLGYSITLITNVIPVILLAVGSAYAIHVINRINQEMVDDPHEALIKALTWIAVPVFLASLTTIFGFLSFIPGSYLTMIREFGMFTASGILFSLIMAVTFIPAVIAIFQIKGVNTSNHERSNRLLKSLTKSLNNIVFRQTKAILAGWALLIVLSVWGITRIERRVDLVDYFKKDNIVQHSEQLFREKFNGTMPLYVQITGNVQSPEVLHMMKTTQTFMESFDYIPYSQSVADLIQQMNDVMGEGNIIPDEQAKIIQLWFLLDGREIMEQLVGYDLSEGIIQGYVATTDFEILREIEINFGQFAERHSSELFTLEVTGIPVLFKRLDDSIIQSQIYSLIMAIILVMTLISIIQQSLIKGLLTIIPVVATLVVLFGIMGITGIPLDIATVLTGSVTIGIGIDYAIHYISYFGHAYKVSPDIPKCIERSMHVSGRAILINLLAVSIGFGVLLLSNLVPLQRFGFLISITMIISGMAALTLLPATLLIAGKHLEKIFALKKMHNKLIKS